MKKLGNKLKNILIAILIIVVALLSIYIIINKESFGIKNKKSVDTVLIASEFKNIKELATYKYNYTDVIYFKDSSEFKGITLPLTEKSFLVKFQGVIKAGIDLDSADISLKNNNEEAVISVPHSKIVDNTLDTSSVKILDEKSAIFNKLESHEILDELNKKKTDVEDELLKSDFLQKSDESTEKLLEGLLKGMGIKKVTIIFK